MTKREWKKNFKAKQVARKSEKWALGKVRQNSAYNKVKKELQS